MQMRFFLGLSLTALACSCTSTGQSPSEQVSRGSLASGDSPQPDAGSAQSAPSAESKGAFRADAENRFAWEASAEPAAAPANPAATSAAQDPNFQQDIELRQRSAQFLSNESVKLGRQFLEQGNLDAALREFARALEVMPSNEEARRGLRDVRALMGDRFSEAAVTFDDVVERATVQRAQARLAAEDAMQAGDEAYRQGDVDAALRHYRQAQLILRYNPLIAGDTLDERIIGGKLRMAEERQAEAAREREGRARAEAEEARRRREQEEIAYRDNRLRGLYTQANQAFLNEKYTLAESLARQILVEDPGNQQAKALESIAREARHQKAEEDQRSDYREQWIRTFQELEELNRFHIDPLVFDDLQRWGEVSQRQPISFGTRDSLSQSDKEAVLERLDSTQAAAKFVGPDGNGSSLTDIANYLQTASGVNFIITPKVQELDEEQRTILLDLNERSIRKILDIIAETSENIRWKVEDGVVKFVHKDELRGGQVLRMYEVRDLIVPLKDFPAREMNVAPSGGVQLAEEELEEREANVVTADTLDKLIRNNVAPASWEADTQNNLRITEHGQMVVHQTPEVQAQIEQLLEDLREATGIMVDIQARFLKVEDNFLEDIGVDFRGLGQPGPGANESFNDFGDPSTQADLGREIGQQSDLGAFYDHGFNGDMRARVEQLYDLGIGDPNAIDGTDDRQQGLGDPEVLRGSGGLSFQWTYLNDLQLQLILRAVSKSERVELVTSPRITVYNTARGNLSVLNHVAYVQDFNVEIAQGASIADPIVNVVQDGVTLDVRPVVSADRRFLTLELRPTVAVLRRPMRELVTTLGSQNSVTIQLPEVAYQRVRTSIPMPDGGTVLLGGNKISDRQDAHAGVPILNKIPLVSFLFDRKGNYVSNRKLLILLRASIVIPTELEPTPAQTRPPSQASRL